MHKTHSIFQPAIGQRLTSGYHELFRLLVHQSVRRSKREMRGQCTFTVKRSTSEARRAKLTGSKLIKKYKQAELVKLGELSL